jgi:hypothetical protein
MKVYAKSLVGGVCAAVVVLGLWWSLSLRPHVVRPPASAASSSADDFTVETVEVIVAPKAPPWYVVALAGLALLTASGWQLRRSGRERQRPSSSSGG